MLGQFRARFAGVLETLARPVAGWGVSPNAVTLISVLACLLYVYFAIREEWGFALGGIALTALLDALDGAVARLSQKTSAFGNYLDAYVDRVIEFLLILPFLVWAPVPAGFFLAGGFLVSYAKARAALVISLDNTDWPGFGERSERLMGTVGIVVGLAVVPNLVKPNAAVLLWILAAFTWAGALLRLNTAKKWIEKAENDGTLVSYVKKDLAKNSEKK